MYSKIQVSEKVENIHGKKACFSLVTLNVTAGYPWQQPKTSWVSIKGKCKGEQGPMLPVSLIIHFHVCISNWFLGCWFFVMFNPCRWQYPVLLLFLTHGWVSFLRPNPKLRRHHERLWQCWALYQAAVPSLSHCVTSVGAAEPAMLRSHTPVSVYGQNEAKRLIFQGRQVCTPG